LNFEDDPAAYATVCQQILLSDNQTNSDTRATSGDSTELEFLNCANDAFDLI